MRKFLLLTWLSLLPCLAQQVVSPDLTGLFYPALAKSAQIQGIVQFRVESGQITLVSGHPFLLGVAKSNLERWASGLSGGKPTLVNYVFHVPPVETNDEPIGNRIDRFFLRLFRRPVTRKVYLCSDPTLRVTTHFVTFADGTIEIDINASPPCVEVNGSYLAQRN